MAQTGLTTGVKNALARRDHHSMCGDCGFALPKYPGRYPKNCPSCGAEKMAAKEESFELEVGQEVHSAEHGKGRVVEVDEGTAYVEYEDGATEEVAG